MAGIFGLCYGFDYKIFCSTQYFSSLCAGNRHIVRHAQKIMKFAVVSAGEGSRLLREGVSVPKPLVRLNGVAMIDRLVGIFKRNGAERVVVIINNEQPLTREHVFRLQAESDVPIEIVVKTTPGSMHSFYALSPFLTDDKFCLTTVDTVFREDEFGVYG